MIRKLFLIFIFLSLFCGLASATATHNGNYLNITGDYTVSSLYTEINDPSVIELSDSHYIFKDCNYIVVPLGSSLNFSGANVSFSPYWCPGQNGATRFDESRFVLNNCIVEGLAYYNTSRGIYRTGCDNLTLRDIYLYNVSKESFQAYSWNDCIVENITTVNNGWAYGDVGFGWYGGNNNHMRYIDANGTARSGLDFTGNATNCSYEYFDVDHARHGFVDFHGQKDCWVANGTIHDGISIDEDSIGYSTDAIIVSGGSTTTLNKSRPSWGDGNWVDNVTIYDYSGRAAAFYNIWNLQIKNVSSENSQFFTIASANVDFINCSSSVADDAVYHGAFGVTGHDWEAWECSFIDCSFAERIGMYQSDDCRLINNNASLFINPSTFNNSYQSYYYISPNVTGASAGYVSVTCNDSSISATDGNADDTDVFEFSNGKTSLPTVDRNNSIAVAQNQTVKIGTASATVTDFSHKIKAVDAATSGTLIYSDRTGFDDLYTIEGNTATHLYGNQYGESEWFTVSESDFRDYPMESIREISVTVSDDGNRIPICSVVIA